MDEATQDKIVEAESNALWEKLRVFAPADRLFILSMIASRVTRKLKSRESTQYAIDFTQDEPPTNPQLPSDRETRAIIADALRGLRKKSTRE